MDGMAGGKGVEGFSRKRHAVKVPADHQTVGTLLVEDRLQQMRQKRNNDRGEQDMVAVGAMARAAMPGVEPLARGERKGHVRRHLDKVVVLRGQTNICAADGTVSKRLAAARKMAASTFALTSG
jgi:hypothetical protein